ncbi:hypothetical protein [Fischerella sp. PCC 9605]|uniref:hypothetical protein n=1 Tax=Fischerella sp. PCC 9605 TaxID=1173024 RepID=UPI00047CA8D6|nr:hypothetical protein [Fischerella sp. PCC 9605]
MSAKGFGQPTKTDKLVEQVVCYCHKRHPEALDKIFDTLPASINKQLVAGTVAALSGDTDTLAWFCGYMASAINRSEDNQKPHHPITLLSKLLIKHQMQPFSDFMPYPGCRLVILNTEKYEALPTEVQKLVQQAYEITEATGEEAQRINNALLEELVVTVQE